MGRTSHIIVNSDEENSIIDSMTDLATYIDKNVKEGLPPLVPVAEQYREVVEAAGDKVQPADVQDYFFTFAEASVAILKTPRADFEPISNLLLYVLSSAPDFDELVPVVLASLTNQLPTVQAQLVALIAVLGNLFNVLDSASEQRAYVFDSLLDVAIIAQSASQFVAQLPQIAAWLEQWAIPEDTKVGIVNKLTQTLADSHPQEICEFLKAVLKFLPDNAPAVETLVSKSLADPKIFDLAPIAALPGVAGLESANADLAAALRATIEGEYSLIAARTLTPAIHRKARTTTLSRMASEKRVLTYAEIQSTLSVGPTEVEKFILYAVKANLVEGRISQLDETFSVASATVFGPVQPVHWDCIESRLANWKRALAAVSQANAHAEENCKLVKLLNKVEA